MNTADKSLIQIDAALRRRFAFVEMMPDSNLSHIKNKVVEGIPLKDLMDKLNKKIREKAHRDKQIGHSYFLKIKDIESLHFVFVYKIIPLLQDYLYGDYDDLHSILSDRFISKTEKVIHQKITDSPEELKNALLSWLDKNDGKEQEIGKDSSD
jgi:5-methylcytosine-specific restriction enzyme B